MSQVGRKPVTLPEAISVDLTQNTLVVKGPKGELTQNVPGDVGLKQEGSSISVEMRNEAAEGALARKGLVRALLLNMIKGVTEGYEKKLELVGAGYRAKVEGNKLNLALGFSHPVWMEQPEGINFAVEENTRIIVKGIDKQLVGETAARIRRLRPPEPYKGKGIKYVGEIVRRKAGKAAKAAEGATK